MSKITKLDDPPVIIPEKAPISHLFLGFVQNTNLLKLEQWRFSHSGEHRNPLDKIISPY